MPTGVKICFNYWVNDMKNLKISTRYCVLDDDEDFISVASGKLNKYLSDLNGVFHTNPEEVLKLAKEKVQTLFIIDINLGTINGLEVYEKLKEISGNARVIFMTGDANFLENEEIREEALSGGAIDFIEKPIKWHELAIKIKNHINIMEYQFNLEAKVQERTELLIHADRLATVGTMVSAIVHEISSPLTFIKINQESYLMAYKNIKDKIQSPEVKNFFENIILPGVQDSLTGITRIEDLLKSFRRFYKKEQIIAEAGIFSIISEVKMLLLFRIKKHEIQFIQENNITEEFRVKCNKQELVQVITNIVNNAVDALTEIKSKKTKKILKLSLEKEAPYIVVKIANNGPKIPEELLENIFEPFFTTKPEEKGTGLGLAIVKQILKNMGGNISINNKKDGKFVEFVVKIPYYKESSAEV